MNKVILLGRMTKSPELKSTQSGNSVCSFTLAVKRKYGEETDFIDCVAWRNTAEFIAKYFNKGQLMLVEGSIQTRSWEDKDGKTRHATEVVVCDVDFCGKKEDVKSNNEVDDETEIDDDLPF